MTNSRFFNLILGESERFVLQKRIFHSAVLSSCIISLVLIIEAFVYEWSLEIKGFLYVNFILLNICYYISRRSPGRYWPVWAYVFINFMVIVADWFWFGGVNGISRPLIVSFAILSPLIVRKKRKKYANLIFSLFYTLLVVFSIVYSQRIQFHSNNDHIIIESIIETGVIAGFMLLIGNVIIISHRQEKQKVVELNESLYNYNLEIQLRNETLSKLDSTKNEFFNIIAHDLRGPVGTMNTINELLLKQYNNLSEEERKDLLVSLAETSRNTFSLLENLLDWSRAESGRMKLNISEIDVTAMVTEVVDLMIPMFKEKKVKLKTKIENAHFHSDKNLIQTILRNALSNALKFTPTEKQVLIATEKQGTDINITISDQGVGMTDEMIDNLFKLDKVRSSLGTESEKGSGLGLILCHQLAKKVGGSISVNSSINEGTTFQLTLPHEIKDEKDIGT